MKQFVVFVWSDYGQCGGWNDLIPRSRGRVDNTPSSFDTVPEAIAAKDAWFSRYGEYTSYQVVDLHTGVVVERGHVKDRL